MPLTIALLDRLDARLDAILMNGAANGNYWPIRYWIDRKRDELAPMVIYPQPAPIVNCPHPPDRDYCGQWYDPERDEMRMWRGCRICGEVWDVPPMSAVFAEKKKRKSRKKATESKAASE